MTDVEEPSSKTITQRLTDNIRGMKFSLAEFSGSLGDLGTFIPLAVALALVTEMDLAAILIFAGLANIATGVLFGLPVPVQPMKAIAAVAIAEQLLPAEIAAAGMMVGAAVLFLGATGLTGTIERLVPRAVIRGIQLGIGIKLALKGIEFIGETASLAAAPLALDSVATALILGVIILLLTPVKRFPSALALLLFGLFIMVLSAPPGALTIQLQLADLSFAIPNAAAWKNGLFSGAIPQLPLTLLNSVLAVCALSGDLFPAKKISTGRMAVSVGLMNIVSCWFGAMPMCHGSGGLAAQHFFGARTGGSVVMLGTGKVIIGALLGTTALAALQLFPKSVLGLMLLFAGVELALPARDQRSRNAFFVMALTAIGILAINTAAGFVIGLAAGLALRLLQPNSAE